MWVFNDDERFATREDAEDDFAGWGKWEAMDAISDKWSYGDVVDAILQTGGDKKQLEKLFYDIENDFLEAYQQMFEEYYHEVEDEENEEEENSNA